MSTVAPNLLLLLNHIARRLFKKVLIVTMALFATAFLYVALSRDFTPASSPIKADENENLFGRGRVSDAFQFPTNSQLFLVICILSAPANGEARQAARESWLTLANKRRFNDERPIRPVFVVGGQNLTDATAESLNEESSRHADLLILNDLVDSYANLTLKIVHAYSWIHANLSPRYVVKCDDDSYVRLDLVADELTRPPLSSHRRLYWGFFDGRARPFKKGKWSETTWNLCDLYLPYALGGGYVVSGSLVAFVAKNAADLRLFFNEDVAMGTWMAPLDVHRRHDPRFDTEYKSRGCFSSYLITHKQTPDLLREKHKNLMSTGSICGGSQNEFRSRLSYDYDWSVPPSQCCHRGSNDLP